MLIFDQLKKNDPQLRVLALAILAGLGVLLAGRRLVQRRADLAPGADGPPIMG